MQPPMGPVFISVPMDDWTHECEQVVARDVSQRIFADRSNLDEVCRALDRSNNPALVVGAQIEEDHAFEQVLALAEHLEIEVYQEPIASRWPFPRRHKLFRGALLPAQRPLAEQLAPHDTVVVLGAPVFLYHSYVPGDPIRTGTNLFQITNSPRDAASALAGKSTVGNLADAAEYLRLHTQKRAAPNFPEPRQVPQPKAESPTTPAFLFSVLNRLIPPDAIIAEECPSSKGDLDRYLLLDQPQSFYSVRSGILGFGVPAAIGLQLAHPKRRVVCPVGDGSIQYSIQALWTAVQYQIPVIFIVLCNSDYSALKSFCDFTQVGRNVSGMDLPGINIAEIAVGYGMKSEALTDPNDLEPALKAAFAAAEPRLISVQIRSDTSNCMGMDQSVRPPKYR
jgi:benzoylformate decarboxylase